MKKEDLKSFYDVRHNVLVFGYYTSKTDVYDGFFSLGDLGFWILYPRCTVETG